MRAIPKVPPSVTPAKIPWRCCAWSKDHLPPPIRTMHDRSGGRSLEGGSDGHQQLPRLTGLPETDEAGDLLARPELTGACRSEAAGLREDRQERVVVVERFHVD